MAELAEEIALVFLQANAGMLNGVLQRIPASMEGANLVEHCANYRRKILQEIEATVKARSGIVDLLVANSEEPPAPERAALLQKKGCRVIAKVDIGWPRIPKGTVGVLTKVDVSNDPWFDFTINGNNVKTWVKLDQTDNLYVLGGA